MSTLNNDENVLETPSLCCVLPRMPYFFPFNAVFGIHIIKFLNKKSVSFGLIIMFCFPLYTFKNVGTKLYSCYCLFIM